MNYTFFWGGIFSNFYPCFFTDSENITYCNSEQYYMAKKALFFKDIYHYNCIISEKNPKKIKKYGRQVVGYSDDLWYSEKDINPAKKAMYDGNYLKYTQNDKIQKALIATRGTLLVEASPFDKRWGIGMSQDNFLARSPEFWRGKNWLGEVLTLVRDNIIKEKESSYLF